jgi:hypothetical protein
MDMEVLTEAVDGDGAFAIVLDDLVRGGLSTSSNDTGIAITLQRERILADVYPPHIFDGASTFAMYAFDLVFADDGVLKGSAVLDEKDSIRVATFSLTSAADTAAVGLHATVEYTRYLLRFLIGDGALGSGNGKGSALVEVEEIVGSGGSRAGGDGSHKSSGGGSDGNERPHCDV